MPSEQKVTYKLRAILSADVKGYSILMADDEVATINTLKQYRGIMSKYIERHGGRVVDAVGDNLLAEFESAVDAVQCAVEVQKELKAKNQELPAEKKLEFRIGVNIGDVIQDGDRIFGDGVNVAARIEGLADASGVCISRNAYDHIKKKLRYGYEYLGEHPVKNISEPVRVYKVLFDPEDAGKLIGAEPKRAKKKWIWPVVVVAIIVTSIVWYFYKNITKPNIDPASIEKMAFQQPDKPSIAILPFVNMSNDPEQEYFSDGMTDELIGDLAKIENIIVISRNSTFTYKDKPTKVQTIAEDLNVQYILEGSVQKSGDKVRIRAQLIEGKTDHHIWSESYDGVLENIFDLQDKITEKIVSALAIRLSAPEADYLSERGTNSPEAHDAYLKGVAHLRLWTPDDLVTAIDYFEKAVALDPNYSGAYTALAGAYVNSILGGREYYDKTGKDFSGAKILMRHYLNLAMSNPTPQTYALLASMECTRRNYLKAISYGEKAINLAPNNADILRGVGYTMIRADKPDIAIEYFDKSRTLDPLNRSVSLKGVAYFALGKYEEAEKCFKDNISTEPNMADNSPFIAATYAFLGRGTEAKKALNEWLSFYVVGFYPSTQTVYSQYALKSNEVFNRLLEGLVKAGYRGDPNDYYEATIQNKLSGQEIKKLLFGKTQKISLGFYNISQHRSQDGKIEYFDAYGDQHDKGQSWIEDDTICDQYEKTWDGIKLCGDVYLNPKANEISMSKYFAIYDYWTLPFSVEE